MTDSKREQLHQLIRDNPFISQQALAQALGLSRSAVAGHVARLMREGRLLGRAYVLPGQHSVACLGGANIDRKFRSAAPLQMGTSNPALLRESHGGVARNVAENLQLLGLPVHLLTAVGDDAAGRALLEHATASGLRTHGCLQVPGVPTGSYTAILDAQGDLVLAMAHMALADHLTPEFVAQSRPVRAAAQLIVIDLNLPAPTIQALQQEALQSGRRLVAVAVSVPKMARLGASLAGIDLLILNRAELESLAGAPLPRLADVQAAFAALHARGLQRLVVTLDVDGVAYGSAANGKPAMHRLGAPKVKVLDVTGAGDAFAAGVCWSLCQEADDLALACRRGLKLSALTLQTEATVHPELKAELLA